MSEKSTHTGYTRPGRTRSRWGRLGVAAVAVAAVTGLTLSGCSSSDDEASDSSSRVTLTIGDQVKSTQSLLEAAGELDNLPYDITWASFESGPPLLEAAGAGKVDFGGTGDVPPVFAQVGGAPIKIVGVQARTEPNDFLLVPDGSPARSIADLKGKKIAFAKGSSSHGLVLALLEQAGLEPDDIDATYLSPTEALSAFSSGQVDAWAVWNPYSTLGQAQAHAKVIADGAGLTTQQVYYLASDQALGDARKREALSDLLGRLTRANQWSVTHADEWVPIFSKLTKLPEPIARATFATGSGPLVPIGDEQIAKQQKLIDLFAGAGEIPRAPKAADYFDAQFNSAVTGAGVSG
ncbi:ABC transporter substrate-binding protein [Gordonia sp. NB41Y]|uniref:ABC transporter substrate-binding protein n=1 Tax=Gordonia sp. NB41Y TaxID=875808 RepID=UPI0021C81F8C|nr:ABC transporter substrate-binding protein [Gordonia sp. NB41Y]WLP92395.1 ABC transporter substrate-binding protein [Gordonia sp. NB41Y]